MAARLIPSWNAPSAIAPSPKKQATTCGCLPHLERQGHPGGQRHAAADDRDPRHHPLGHVADVHRPALAAAAARHRAEELEQQLLEREPLRQGMAVAAEGGRDEIRLHRAPNRPRRPSPPGPGTGGSSPASPPRGTGTSPPPRTRGSGPSAGRGPSGIRGDSPTGPASLRRPPRTTSRASRFRAKNDRRSPTACVIAAGRSAVASSATARHDPGRARERPAGVVLNRAVRRTRGRIRGRLLGGLERRDRLAHRHLRSGRDGDGPGASPTPPTPPRGSPCRSRPPAADPRAGPPGQPPPAISAA